MRFCDAAKEIVQVAHDVLVGADHENAEVINFARDDPMQGQGVLHVLEIDELRDLAVRVAGNIDEHAVTIRRRGQTMDRHDREQLPERPMIEQ